MIYSFVFQKRLEAALIDDVKLPFLPDVDVEMLIKCVTLVLSRGLQRGTTIPDVLEEYVLLRYVCCGLDSASCVGSFLVLVPSCTSRVVVSAGVCLCMHLKIRVSTVLIADSFSFSLNGLFIDVVRHSALCLSLPFLYILLFVVVVGSIVVSHLVLLPLSLKSG